MFDEATQSVLESDEIKIKDLTEEDIPLSDSTKPITEKEELSSEDIELICKDLILPFIDMLAPYPLYDYQKMVALGICYIVLDRKADDITVLISRQGGKSYTIAATVSGLGIILPAIAKFFKAKQLRPFKDKFRVGVYGPDYDKAGIIYERIKEVLTNENALKILTSPDFKIDPKEIKGLKFNTGFSVDLRTANKNSKIEGMTYELIITDETQDIDGYILSKSLSPMRTATGGSMVHIGTPVPKKCFFSEACFRNKEYDMLSGKEGNPFRQHYEFNWEHPARNNPFYNNTIQKEKDRLGEHSDEFRMAYNIEWLQSRGLLISHQKLNRCGISATRIDKVKVVRHGMEPFVSEFKRPAHIVSADINTEDQAFSIDFGKINDSTVLTTGRVWWDNPIRVGDEDRYHIHIQDWLEIVGSDHEEQHPELMNTIKNKYKMGCGIVDATGKGDPIYSRMSGELLYDGVDVHPFIFTARSKHEGYLLLQQEIEAGRVTFPNGKAVRTYRKHKEFIKQVSSLVKDYKGSSNYMSVSHPSMSGYHDDYADSLMMLVWLVNKLGRMSINVLSNKNFRSNRFLRDMYADARIKPTGYSRTKHRFWR